MTRWYSEKKKEHYYKEAKRVGYRARSAFKLKQIQNKFKVIRKGDFVIDLGAAPGGWSQVAKEIVGDKGKVVGIDQDYINPVDGITFLQGDLTENSTMEEIRALVGNRNADVVLSDMSPDISGNYSVDQARSIYLCEHALKIADQLLKQDGTLICKVFEGEDLRSFLDEVKRKFKSVNCFSPPASRQSSSEIYIIAKLFQK